MNISQIAAADVQVGMHVINVGTVTRIDRKDFYVEFQFAGGRDAAFSEYGPVFVIGKPSTIKMGFTNE